MLKCYCKQITDLPESGFRKCRYRIDWSKQRSTNLNVNIECA
jgi:hypothetical protein